VTNIQILNDKCKFFVVVSIQNEERTVSSLFELKQHQNFVFSIWFLVLDRSNEKKKCSHDLVSKNLLAARPF
jgi:hypothetical protein